MATKTQIARVRMQSVIDQEPGVKIDSWGNRKFGDYIRVKFSSKVWRLEVKSRYSNQWVRRASEYYVKTTMGQLNDLCKRIRNLQSLDD